MVPTWNFAVVHATGKLRPVEGKALDAMLARLVAKFESYEGTSYEDFTLEGDGFVLHIPRSKMCILVEPARPARYECPSILSDEEEAALGPF